MNLILSEWKAIKRSLMMCLTKNKRVIVNQNGVYGGFLAGILQEELRVRVGSRK